MTEYSVNSDEYETRFDLCGVINHHGEIMDQGHYTAFASTHSTDNTSTNDIGKIIMTFVNKIYLVGF